jgi:hypothetical protein
MTAAPKQPLVEVVEEAIRNAPVERVVVEKRMKADLDGDGSDMVVTKEVVEFRVTDKSRARAALAAFHAEELAATLREYIAAADECVSGDNDVAAMLRFWAADKKARAVLAKLAGQP